MYHFSQITRKFPSMIGNIVQLPFYNINNTPYLKDIVKDVEVHILNNILVPFSQNFFEKLKNADFEYLKPYNPNDKKNNTKNKSMGISSAFERNVHTYFTVYLLKNNLLVQDDLFFIEDHSDHYFEISLSNELIHKFIDSYHTKIENKILFNLDSKVAHISDSDASFDCVHFGINQCSLDQAKEYKKARSEDTYKIKGNQKKIYNNILNITSILKMVWECPPFTKNYKCNTLHLYLIPNGLYSNDLNKIGDGKRPKNYNNGFAGEIRIMKNELYYWQCIEFK